MTTKTDSIASAAIGLSLAATLSVLVVIPVVFEKGSHLQFDLLSGMEEFKTVADDSWERLMAVKIGKASLYRQRRQDTCRCYDCK